eukprot:jgi/Picsp_1/1288/NSC_04769-R1_regulator of nonsense transcripts 1 homolog
MICDHYLCGQVGTEAISKKKSVACISPKSCRQERYTAAYFAGRRGGSWDAKATKRATNITIYSSRLRVLGARSDLDAQSLTLQESLRLAVLAEVEEEEKASSSSMNDKGSSVLMDVGVSPVGRLYSEMIWRVHPSNEQTKKILGSRTRFKAGVAVFIRAQSKSTRRVEGTVYQTDGESMLIAMNPEDSSMLSRSTSSGTLVDIHLGYTSVTSKRQLEAIGKLGSKMENDRVGARAVRAILLGSKQSVALAATPPAWIESKSAIEAAKVALQNLRDNKNLGLNQSQCVAIASALSRRVTLWTGPPGTGKTRTVIGFASVICSMRERSMDTKQNLGRVLAIAETNAAADNLLEGIGLLGLRVTRVGQTSRIRPQLRHLSLEAQGEASRRGRRAASMRDQASEFMVEARCCRERRENGSLLKAQQLDVESTRLWKAAELEMESSFLEVLEKSDVVVCTCVSAGDKRIADCSFRVVIIDEATQAVAPSALIGLVRGAECVVMAGDDAQLPPTVLSEKAKGYGLGISLFSRLESAGLKSHLLSTQYRMHEYISSFPNKQFYDRKLSTGISVAERPPIKGIVHEPGMPVKFIPCRALERKVRLSSGSLPGARAGMSYSNEEQADIASKLVECILKDDSVSECAVLTPYNGQLMLLNSKMESTFPDDLKSGRLIISTIDGFQGREADAVVFTTVRCNNKHSLGFVKDPRRINVALTRARRLLAVIGSPESLSKGSPIWAAWFQWLTNLN